MAIQKALVDHKLNGIQENYVDVQAEAARPYLERLWETDNE